MAYSGSRGGHAPGHLRDEFLELVPFISRFAVPRIWTDTFGAEFHEAMGQVDVDRLRRLTDLLWNCSDVLPWYYREELELPQGSTYAQAARRVRERVVERMDNLRMTPEDAIQPNAVHGKPLSPADLARCVDVSQEVHLSPARLEAALGLR